MWTYSLRSEDLQERFDLRDPAYSALSPDFFERVEPALHTLLDKAAAAGTVRSGMRA